MMNRFIYLFLLLGCTALTTVGCTVDPDVEPQAPGSVGEGTSWVTIDFGDDSFDEVNITTRATLDNIAESRVGNLFVFVFGPKEKDEDGNYKKDENGNYIEPRLYGRFFDFKNRVEDTEFGSTKGECWYVEHNADATNPAGKVRINAPNVTGGSLYILANVNADMVNVSPDKLRFVQSRADLENMTASLNQQIAERNGFFPMTGWAENVEIKTNGTDNSTSSITIDRSPQNPDGKIMLTRIDAKVVVKLRVDKGYTGTNPETNSKHTINSFLPLSWQVVNLPRTAFVLPRSEDARDDKGKKDLFNTRETKFETRETIKDEKGDPIIYENGEFNYEHGFSFYMLENRPDLTDKPKISTLTENPNLKLNPKDDRSDASWRYHLRDTRKKDDDTGAYSPDKETGAIWEYAPEEGTYLIIKGEIVMSLDVDEPKDQQLSADVVYYIHLGDFATNVDNYNIERNTSYTYTITIYGVDNIEIEVVKGKEERESGATGHVYVAKEEIFTFDSHFASAEISFDEAHLDKVKDLTWYVRTPFGREGRPHIVNGVEVPAGLDYQWVKFKRNTINDKNEYNHNQEKYDPAEVKDVLVFSKYIKEQKDKFDAWQEAKKTDETAVNESDFRPEIDEEWKKEYPNNPELYTRYRIHLTIFVDEFYYDADPLTGDVRPDLWKDFVNQPYRLMHILCDADKSADEASLSTGSVVTIRQRSIQTIFNTQKPELMTAWGCETIDETRDVLNYYTKGEYFSGNDRMVPGNGTMPKEGLPTNPDDFGENSEGNGLYNTARIWGLISKGKYTAKEWSKYVDPNLAYGLIDKDTIRTLRYSCMTRNRDENGNGFIDAKEVKWYMAAIKQLGSLYIGDQGLSADAVLYPYDKQAIRTNSLENGVYEWRSHIVSSTAFVATGDKRPKYPYYPEILWAEEGLSTGSYQRTWRKLAGLSVRCVRNLGMEPHDENDAQTKIMDINNMPTQAIRVSGPGLDESGSLIQGATIPANAVYNFDQTNLNPLSIRYYTSQELEPNNEFSVEAKTYWAFETGPMSILSYTYPALQTLIRDGKSPCPDGYRTPNVREGALISLFCPPSWQGSDSRVSTEYSHGILGDNPLDPGSSNSDDTKPYSWLFNGTQVNLDKKKDNGYDVTARVRCVRDIRQ